MIRRMQATRILAVRHGETAWNVDGRIQGHLDIALSDVGRAQARRLGRALAEREPLALIVSSDLARARETARIVADAAGAPLRTTTALRERCFGIWEGHTYAEVEQRWPNESAQWRVRNPAFSSDCSRSASDL